jgi:hypothetical protein
MTGWPAHKCNTWCYTSRVMPTSRKRHSITETDEVASVLDRVRAETGGSLDLPELVRLGAEAKLRELSAARAADQRRSVLRQRFAERTATAEGIDVDALREVHEQGWAGG